MIGLKQWPVNASTSLPVSEFDELRRAGVEVCRRSVSRDDARMLLSMLGLLNKLKADIL